MGKLLLHLSFILSPYDKHDRVRIAEFKEFYTILLYDKDLNLVPITIDPKIHMSYTNNLSIGFQCDFTIQSIHDVVLIPQKDQKKPYLVNCSSCIRDGHSFLIIYFENGYQMWTDCPFYFLYQKMSEQTARTVKANCTENDWMIADYKSHNWYFDQLSYSLIDENLQILYSKLF